MIPSPQAILLFAAGFGTRMGDLTRDRPKPLIEVAGKPLLDHALSLAEAAEIPQKVVNAHYHADMISAHLAGQDIRVSVEAPDILDTGGGLRHALPLLGSGPVFTLNTDAVWSGPNPLNTLRQAWDPARMSGLLLLVPADHATGHGGSGDFTLQADHRITRQGPMVYSGAGILDPEGIDAVPDVAFSLNRLWDRMLQDHRLFGVVHQGGWCDVGHPEGIGLAESLLGAHT
ncbi:MAG: nucleotidyltransferase family protein [Pseudomonadota bacterium]